MQEIDFTWDSKYITCTADQSDQFTVRPVSKQTQFRHVCPIHWFLQSCKDPLPRSGTWQRIMSPPVHLSLQLRLDQRDVSMCFAQIEEDPRQNLLHMFVDCVANSSQNTVEEFLHPMGLWQTGG